MSSDEPQGESASTPTPVRELMGADPLPARARGDGDLPVEQEPVGAAFRAEGVDWIAEVMGKTRTGEASDSGAVLLLLGFRQVRSGSRGGSSVEREQGGPEEGAPEREAWSVARSLDDLSEVQLVELLARSRPWRSPAEEDLTAGRRPGPGRQRLRSAGPGD